MLIPALKGADIISGFESFQLFFSDFFSGLFGEDYRGQRLSVEINGLFEILCLKGTDNRKRSAPEGNCLLARQLVTPRRAAICSSRMIAVWSSSVKPSPAGEEGIEVR